MAARPGQDNILVCTCTRFRLCTLFHKLSMFFPYIQSCEAHKQFGAEPAQYGLEINFNFDNFADLPTLTVSP